MIQDPCKFCYTSPCRCDTFLVSESEIEVWSDSGGDYLNRASARRIMSTVQSLRTQLSTEREARQKAERERDSAQADLKLACFDVRALQAERDEARATITKLEAQLKLEWDKDSVISDRNLTITRMEAEIRGLIQNRDALMGEPEAVHIGAAAAIESIRQFNAKWREHEATFECVQKIITDYNMRGSVAAPLLDALVKSVEGERPKRYNEDDFPHGCIDTKPGFRTVEELAAMSATQEKPDGK